jgi:hypothetical protein
MEQSRGIGGMSRRTAAWLAYFLAALAVLLGVLGSLLLLLNDRFPPPSWDILLGFVTFLVVGGLIASRRPENPIGWMFCLIGLASLWDFFSQEYAFYALVTQPGTLPGGVWMAWTEILTAAIAWPLMFFSLLLFPTGRLPSPRWRPVAWAAAVTFILTAVLSALEPGRLLYVPAPNPTGIEQAGGIIELSLNIVIVIFLGIVLAIAASVIGRFRRARGEEREQLKWLAFSALFLGTLAVLGVLNTMVVGNRVFEFAVGILATFAVAAIPVSVGIAILRYRLYDIDLLINRTLVCGSLTALLAAGYVATIMAFQGIGSLLYQVPFRALIGQESALATVAATLAMAALFNPLRRRIQSFIDRRFYRSKYDAIKTLETFSATLRDETDLEALRGDLVGVVTETMQPAHVSLWLRPDTASRGKSAG